MRVTIAALTIRRDPVNLSRVRAYEETMMAFCHHHLT